VAVALLTSPPASPRVGPAPRVDTHPPYVNSFGPEAVELAAAAGLYLDPWQQDALHTLLAFDADTGKWCCFEYAELVSRQNGKGAVLEARCLAGLLLLGEELIMWSAHEVKTAMEGFRRFQKLIKRLAVKVNPKDPNLWYIEELNRLVKINNQNGEEGFELTDPDSVPKDERRPDQRLRFIARSKNSGRGFSGDVNIIDEAFAYTHSQHEALLPTVSARPNGQFIYTSSPPLDGASGDVLYQLRLRGDPEAPRTEDDGPWEQDPELGYRDWGLAGDLEHLDDVDLASEENHRKTNPSLGQGRLTFKDIRRELKSMSAAGFARERLGIWPRQITTGAGGGVVDAQLWKDLAVDAAKVGRPREIAVAVVVAADRSRTAIVAVGPQDDGRLQTSVMAYLPGTIGVVDTMVKIREKWNPIGWAVEDKGPTATLWPEMQRRGFQAAEKPDQPVRGEVAVPWASDVAAAFGLWIDACKARLIWHVGDEPLTTAVTGGETRKMTSGGTTWDYNSPVDVSAGRGATNAHWLYDRWAALVTEDRTPNIW
jgi:phage terminase large subunit-like protein